MSQSRVRSRKVDGSWRVEVTELDDHGRPSVEHAHHRRFPTRADARKLEVPVRRHLEDGLHLTLAHWSSTDLSQEEEAA